MDDHKRAKMSCQKGDDFEDLLFDLMDKLDERISRYKMECPTKKKLKGFYDLVDELKMHVCRDDFETMRDIIKNSREDLGQGLRKANWENKEDFNLYKKTVLEMWQKIINHLRMEEKEDKKEAFKKRLKRKFSMFLEDASLDNSSCKKYIRELKSDLKYLI